MSDRKESGVGIGPDEAASISSRFPQISRLQREKERQTPRDSQLISFGERITYTFCIGNEVASIHYDQGRGKIFYKGHNISNADVQPWHIDLLRYFQKVLEDSEYGDEFAEGYKELLDKILAQRR